MSCGNNTTSTNVGNATNTNNNKRIKNVSLATNNIADTKNVIQNVNSDGASSTNKRRRPSEDDDSSPLDDSSSKEISVTDILLPYEGPELAEETLRALASKQGWRFGIGQRNIATIQRALFDYYNKVDNGVDKLQKDIAAINNGEYSSDSDSDDDDDDELEEINKKSLVAAEEDDGDFRFENGDGDESTNGTTAGLDTASADVPLHDNATQSSTTTTTLKFDISCTGCGVKDDDGNGVKDNESNGVVEDNRIEPSPTNVEADLSDYNNDDTPSSLCYETLSPKKGEVYCVLHFCFIIILLSHAYPSISSVNAKDYVGNNNTPTTAMSTSQTIQTSPSSAFTANRKESERYEDQAPSNHGMLLQQFQQQQQQLSFPQHQYYDRATLESMIDEEQHLNEQIQQKELLMQQRQQLQWNLQERQIVQQWMLLQQHQLQQLKERLLHILQQKRQWHFAYAQQQLLQQQQQREYQQMQYQQFLRQQTQSFEARYGYAFQLQQQLLAQETEANKKRAAEKKSQQTQVKSFEARSGSAFQLQQQLLAQETEPNKKLEQEADKKRGNAEIKLFKADKKHERLEKMIILLLIQRSVLK